MPRSTILALVGAYGLWFWLDALSSLPLRDVSMRTLNSSFAMLPVYTLLTMLST